MLAFEFELVILGRTSNLTNALKKNFFQVLQKLQTLFIRTNEHAFLFNNLYWIWIILHLLI